MLHAGIPYFDAPRWPLELPFFGPLTLGVFGPTVAIGVLVGMQFSLRYAKHKDLDEWMARDQIFWTLVFGFVISHWVSVIFYFPERMYEDPWVLLMIWNGLSSVGGFAGAFIGMRWFLWRHKQPVLVYADMNMYGLLIGMIFGRLGCSMVHDHPGVQTDPTNPFAVGPWPCPCPDGGRWLSSCCAEGAGVWRYDLGLIEFVILLALGGFIYFLYDWRKAPAGQLTGIISLVYGPTRFLLDALREPEVSANVSAPDARYLGLTPAQYATIAFTLVGIYLVFVRKPKPSDQAYAKDSERLARERAEDAETEGADAADATDRAPDGASPDPSSEDSERNSDEGDEIEAPRA